MAQRQQEMYFEARIANIKEQEENKRLTEQVKSLIISQYRSIDQIDINSSDKLN